MAIEFTVFCDDCGGIIHASRKSLRAAKAEAQLQCGAVSSGGKDYCRSCRLERTKLTPEQREVASGAAHSVGTGKARLMAARDKPDPTRCRCGGTASDRRNTAVCYIPGCPYPGIAALGPR